MLNISKNQLNKKVDLTKYKSGEKVFHKRHFKHFNRFLLAFAITGIIILFLPWTQNINSRGNVTTLTPDQRPQTIQSPIPGRIEKWYVREGDFVKQGDTILFISEIKNEYFDPNLVDRTGIQIKAKENAVSSYSSKVGSLTNQIGALKRERRLKLEQAQNKLYQAKLKVQNDSIKLEAAKIDNAIAKRQIDATQSLYEEGLKSLTEFEAKKSKFQENQAKLVSQENSLFAAKNEVINARIEINRIEAEYLDKISKAESEKFTAQSNQFDAEAQVTKLESDFTSYEIRNDLYYIRAPQNGYINKAIKGGLGETFKEGEELVGIMPANYDLAVEMFVEPIDLPLVHIGEKVRVQFDGWPAIVFSGWPNVSYGTYGAKVVAIENFISSNGKFRILIAPDQDDHAWPEDIRVGSGAKTIALLEDVPIWFELWRKLNGFPPNYYQPENGMTAKMDKK
ncbi:HlyD family secretion protein [Psychroserpens sp.]|uniref:HlyD family secretion protein n=1 Tax=Psychroserpens sp. TaxID=2020870 RepID=UPI001B20298D|nr:biotin/lipoyl-binding protein [Psychroserpens sp.]MBO6606503.1 HlyD family efflux transporter periplasmic adaptor subunit [Psychroserpens sp.]MBO6653207.1 HlyD family efflux transporter periplasmic adaptor subunit [Psychroserpens sp.]MBO6680765.1 HlyD family efflux transporter periplasmic adaptor subunit [Psychroserpens sp.]MBO6750277.1 HlyD family efflux transporter periplasmic adaptor subunit [Psychroserpens sp.]MBO6914758.1 HlyD family efflux transporter periplasmic adaptor subunit [Psyc